jgi:hypothetical protein
VTEAARIVEEESEAGVRAFSSFERLQLMAPVACRLYLFSRQDLIDLVPYSAVGDLEIGRHAFPQMTGRTSEVIDGMGGNVRVIR